MSILVLYNSRGGSTRQVAETISSAAATEHNVKAVVKSVAEARQADVDTANVVFIGTWVHGLILFGVRPAQAELWVPSLPPLDGKDVALFCTYAFHPRQSLTILADMITARGANVVAQQAFHRKRLGTGLDAFVTTALASHL